MKKVLLAIAMVAASFTVNAQEASQTAKGKFLIEGNTAFGGNAGHASNTGFSLTSTTAGKDADSVTGYNLGLEGGYFVMDNLAIKLGLGFGEQAGADDTKFSYKIGAKYYVISKIPVQIDYSGFSQGDFDGSSFGLQAGYAIFLGDMVSIEPGLRYNLGLGDAKDFNQLQFNVGFALHI